MILGGQWGDEGKGKLIDIMAEKYDMVVRATGGANAGHTVVVPDPDNPDQTKKHVFHLMLSGMLYPNVQGIIGNGVVVHMPTLLEEIDHLKESNISVDGRLFLSDRAHLLFEYHKIIDGLQEERKGDKKVGTTKRGIGPCYTDKMARIGIRAHELRNLQKFETRLRANAELLQKMHGFEYDVETDLNFYRENHERILPFLADTTHLVHKAIADGKNILLEGANAALLDIDHGTYPFVTSSNPSIGGALTGTGIPASKITSAIGIMKAYCTRVGAGPFPTELDNELGNQIREAGGEYGSTTGRPRRCGWFDAVASKYSTDLNGLSSVNLTKLDVLDQLKTVKICVAYHLDGKKLDAFPASLDDLARVEPEYIELPGWQEDISGARTISDLPENAQAYVAKVEELLGCPVDFVGVGVSREQMAKK